MFFSSSSSQVQVSASPLARAPADLLIEIALFIEARSDLLSFCLASSYVFSHVSAVLYENVVLESVEQCNLTLGMLVRNHNISRHVRELVIRPAAKYKEYFSHADSALVSLCVRKTAGAMCLDALVRFRWDTDELPYNEDMWFALRVGCPQLKYIETSIGCCLPSMNSHLFDFQDLIGFSLILKRGFYETHTDMFLDEDESIFKKLSSMLVDRCPNLEELMIEGISDIPVDVHYLLDGRWPKLRKLAFGDIYFEWFPRVLSLGEKRPFISFLEAHPGLESLSLSKHIALPIHLTTLDQSALNNLTCFAGTLQQLHALPQFHRSIKSVVFRNPVETREVYAPMVTSLLRDLTSLTNLRISFTLHSTYDSGHLLRSLIQSCPLLRHLELTCGHKPSFQLDSFAKTIRGFPKLRSLHLTIVKYPGDESLAAGAARIAKSNPLLHKFSLTFIPPIYPVSLPFSLPYRRFLFPAFSSGTFEVSCDHHGLPQSLFAVEHSRFIWPLGLGNTFWTKKYWKDLRPYRGRGKGVLGLIVERSSAGEEVRLILFCSFLALLATVGIVVNGTTAK